MTSFGCCFTGWLASQNVKLRGQGSSEENSLWLLHYMHNLERLEMKWDRQEFENLGLLVLDSITDETATGDVG